MKRSILLLVLLLGFIGAAPSLAQVDSLGLAIPIEVEDETTGGDIICSLDGGLGLCRSDYDPAMYGVITQSPSIDLAAPDESGPMAVTTGDAIVRVSTVNGPIVAGDIITSSSKPGVGQKATVNGFALGVAMEEYASEDPDDIGEILVSINIHPTSSFVGSRSNLVSSIRQALSAPVVAPLDSLRYLLAFIVAMISFALGFIYFGRVVRTGVEAIGRNPLAKRAIQATIAANIVVTVVIVLAGLGLALLILIV